MQHYSYWSCSSVMIFARKISHILMVIFNLNHNYCLNFIVRVKDQSVFASSIHVYRRLDFLNPKFYVIFIFRLKKNHSKIKMFSIKILLDLYFNLCNDLFSVNFIQKSHLSVIVPFNSWLRGNIKGKEKMGFIIYIYYMILNCSL